MPFDIPTLPALVERTARAFRANLKGSDAWLYPNNVADSSKVIAGAVWEPFSFLAWIWRQRFAHLCDGDMLDRHGAELGMPRHQPAFASGKVSLTGTPGLAITAGLVLQRADGVRYEIVAASVMSGTGEADVLVEAQTAGKAGNAIAGVSLTLTAPVSGIASQAEVAPVGVGGGADTEPHEAYRSRILFRKRFVPHGGAPHDYVLWARNVPGVTDVFVDPVTMDNGRSTVGIWFLMMDTYTNGIPQSADVDLVAATIAAVKPAGARVVVAAPVAVPVNIVVQGLAPDTTAVRGQIAVELAAMFRREMRVATLTAPAAVYRSKISEAISIATGEDHHVLAQPAADVALTAGQVATLGTITYVGA